MHGRAIRKASLKMMLARSRSRACAATLLVALVFPFSLFSSDGPPAAGSRSVPAPAFSLAMSGPRLAQAAPISTAPPTAEAYTFRTLTRDFLKDAGRIWSYPVHIQARDIVPIAALATVTGLLVANDESIYRGFRTYRDGHGWVRAVSPVITKMGSWGAWGTAGAFLAIGLIAGDKKSTETAVLAANAMLQSELLVGFLKGLFGRQRPEAAGGVDHWSGPAGFFKMYEKGKLGFYDSFPSGHAITAFALATVLAMQYRETVWVPILSYTVAAGVGLSRVTESKHWLSDVLVGGALGCLVGRLVVRHHRQRYHVTPAVGLDHGSLSIAVTLAR
jgi:membrane-associated phospholipid phosphatase